MNMGTRIFKLLWFVFGEIFKLFLAPVATILRCSFVALCGFCTPKTLLAVNVRFLKKISFYQCVRISCILFNSNIHFFR